MGKRDSPAGGAVRPLIVAGERYCAARPANRAERSEPAWRSRLAGREVATRFPPAARPKPPAEYKQARHSVARAANRAASRRLRLRSQRAFRAYGSLLSARYVPIRLASPK